MMQRRNRCDICGNSPNFLYCWRNEQPRICDTCFHDTAHHTVADLHTPVCQDCEQRPALVRCHSHHRAWCYDCFRNHPGCITDRHYLFVIPLSSHMSCVSPTQHGGRRRARGGRVDQSSRGGRQMGRGLAQLQQAAGPNLDLQLGLPVAAGPSSGRDTSISEGARPAVQPQAAAGSSHTDIRSPLPEMDNGCFRCKAVWPLTYCHMNQRAVVARGTSHDIPPFVHAHLQSPLCQECCERPAFLKCYNENRTLCTVCFFGQRICIRERHFVDVVQFSSHEACTIPVSRPSSVYVGSRKKRTGRGNGEGSSGPDGKRPCPSLHQVQPQGAALSKAAGKQQVRQNEDKVKEESTSSSETEGGENGGGSDLDEKKDLKDNPESEDNESGEDGENQKKFESDDSEKKTSDDDTETKTEKENTETNVDVQVEQESQPKNETSGGDLLPPGAQLELVSETMAQNGSFSTQATESKNEKEAQKSSGEQLDYKWTLCNTTAGPDYIPCLDNVQAIRSLRSTKHYEHRERHCPASPPTCLVPLPEGYKRPIEWPKSREKIWYSNVPHTKLAEYKGHQNWVKVTGEYLTFPGGGTQFKHGALHYIDFIQESVPDIAWGKRSRVVLDVGCGVASFGGFLFDRDVITMSLAPKDEHEAQVQFALERGIPAISAVMGTTRLPFPGRVFDIVHCALCRVPWHIEGGKLLLELNRLLRPGGFFVWSATPVYQKKTEDVGIWKAMSELTKKMCWELISINKDTINGVGVATYRKPTSNECYTSRSEQKPPVCADSDDPNASWKVPLQACMHTAPEDKTQRGSQWPEQWPARLEKPPFWLLSSQTGVYGKAAPEDFTADYEHWKRVVTKSYLKGLGINWASVRNVMDMRAVYGGFAAALRDMKVWVMNVVPIDSPDTLAIIYERGLFGIYHDWCESFSTCPRSYDLLHADHLFSKLKQRCNLTAVIAEVDRILRPEGKLIVRDDAETIQQVEGMVKAMKWDVRMTYSKEKEGLLSVQKSFWRPKEVETLTYAIA